MARLLIAQSPENPSIREAAEALRAGQLVVFPTETVYGLGGDARDDKAVAAIFEAKGRPAFNPLIVHFPDADSLSSVAEVNSMAQSLAAAFMPGPLTLILPRKKDAQLSWLVSAGTETVGVRVPSHPIAHALLKAARIPVAAPSANPSGRLSATSPLHVMESLGEQVDIVLGAGRTSIGIESTVLDLTSSIPTLLRPGAVTREQIEHVIGKIKSAEGGSEAQPKSPGRLESHYAPRARLRMNAKNVEADEAFLAFGPDFGLKGGKKRLNLSERGDLHEAASNLFAYLRELDQPGISCIAVMTIPETGLGVAINDRLRRAAAPRS
jgi:L-threonylcarbamoyladenylate synthase